MPAGYSGKYHRLSSLWRGFLYLSFNMMLWRNKHVHFNFSSLTSLVFLVLLPKNGTKWILMLHHGVLESRLPDVLVRYVLRRCDHIVYMNEAQYTSYRLHGVRGSKLVKASSYVRPVPGTPDTVFQQDIESYCAARPTFVASGYPTRWYNLDWCIRFVGQREQYQLALFVYGDGPEKAEIQKQVGRCENVRVYWDQTEDNFNYALSKCFHYLRPNTRDSFGIAVADAVNYGVPVLASDVCPRYQGARTFTLTTYESFENALLDSLNNRGAAVASEAAPVVPFSYDLIQ
ncbi:MAG: hypothetical protein AUH78_23115 [Gemmatimonadetes bacterium 13_1_40CM_4_69_8]|nr:MAG: hypothetical protein AUH78_23115 [Gemmatimonadetes bacterium 13_1_40CM_4_69_8]